MVWVPAMGQRQAKRTVLGMVRSELDLFCQMPVVSFVSVPSMKTRACPASQHCSPSVPISAMPVPMKVMEAGKVAVVIAMVWLVASAHAAIADGLPSGFNAASAKVRA